MRAHLSTFLVFCSALEGSDNLAAGAIFPAVFAAGIMVLALAGGKSPTIPVLMVAAEVALVLFMHVFILRLDAAELGLLLFYCCMLHYYLSRADPEHLRLLPIAGVLLTPFLLLSPVRPDKKQFKASTSMGTALSVMALAIFIVMTTPEFRPALSAFPKGLVILSHVIRDRNMTDSDRMLGDVPPPKVWSSIYADEEEMAALRYFRERTSASTPLFVGFNDHSRIFWNDIRMYWLAGRPMAARIFQLEARVATEAPVQSKIIADLEKKKDVWIILDTESDYVRPLLVFTRASDEIAPTSVSVLA